MPKRVTETELERIEDVLLRHSAGLSLLKLQRELGGSISRRTLSRRLSALLAANRIHRRGEARSTRYVHGPVPTAQRLQHVELEGRASGAGPAAAIASVGKPAEPTGP